MPRRKKRKIGFHYLTLISGDIEILDALNRTLTKIEELDNTERKLNITNNKFGLISNINRYNENTRHQIIFKTAMHNFRPPLLDSETVNERDSPKRIEEGEILRTHFVTKAIDGDIIVVLEKFLGSVSMKQAVKYLNHFANIVENEENIKFGYETIAKDDFLEEINALSRITCADVFVDKQLLGGDSLNYSERLSSIKHEIMISVKAKNRDSITDFALDAFAKINGGENSVSKLRIVGRNDDNNEVKINTDFIERQEYVMPHINEDTGEILSEEILQEIEIVLRNYN